ncbi:hypothetical protein RA307_15155 [Xanthobacteraceae bacterium Astr-EGSB]|uniref:hypothetical protein n=1 Tax=Astrobacterium formosum TaxID=3069710 RepID=UPI0027B4797A|nr:hypothetical protein [Xanthobacteraceae bacterium Astr-EGSB]
MQRPQIPSKIELQAAMRHLQRLHRRWCRSRRADHLYAYLSRVYRLFRRWQKGEVASRAAKRLAALSGIATSRRRHPLRAIIDVTSGADRKTKSRWTRALRYYAWFKRKHSKTGGLVQCLRANGGVAGVAQKWADTHAVMRTLPGFVRVGGENRVPKIPFLVHVDLVDEYRIW